MVRRGATHQLASLVLALPVDAVPHRQQHAKGHAADGAKHQLPGRQAEQLDKDGHQAQPCAARKGSRRWGAERREPAWTGCSARRAGSPSEGQAGTTNPARSEPARRLGRPIKQEAGQQGGCSRKGSFEDGAAGDALLGLHLRRRLQRCPGLGRGLGPRQHRCCTRWAAKKRAA